MVLLPFRKSTHEFDLGPKIFLQQTAQLDAPSKFFSSSHIGDCLSFSSCPKVSVKQKLVKKPSFPHFFVNLENIYAELCHIFFDLPNKLF